MEKSKVEEGQRYGRLLVMSKHETKNGVYSWNCLCDCGRVKVVQRGALLLGKTKSCGRAPCRKSPRKHRIILVEPGEVYNGIEVLGRVEDAPNGSARFECRCHCGATLVELAPKLVRGLRKSCGCILEGRTRDKHPNWTGHGDIHGSLWNKIVQGCTRRSLEMDITIEFAWDLFLRQGRRCALTGLPLTFSEKAESEQSSRRTASLDRIDSSAGYTEGNVQWVHVDINFMKQRFSEDYFVEMCRLVSEHRGGRGRQSYNEELLN